MMRLMLCTVLLAAMALAGCQSNAPSAEEEKQMRAGMQNTNPDLSKMRPEDRAMLEKFMQRPAGGPPPPPPAAPKP
jgi:PBP1b-binding outer membrane lipoprotein LpoB